LIIGGGVIGLSVARELARRKQGSVLLVEKESSVGQHASGRNSGVIHSGINQKPRSLKARMCVEGSKRLREYCRDRSVPMNECGTLVIARNQKESSLLDPLYEMGQACGVPGLTLISREELLEREPVSRGIRALLSPKGATVDSKRLTESVADDAKSLGAEIICSCRVLDITGNRVETTQGEFQTRYLINCAGLYADKIAHMMGVGRSYRIIPFRGEYMEIKGCDAVQRGVLVVVEPHQTHPARHSCVVLPEKIITWKRKVARRQAKTNIT